MMNSTMDRLHQDLVIAFRRLRSTPGFTLAAILTLALGVGANTTIFSGVNALLCRTMQVKRHQEQVTLDIVGNNEGIRCSLIPTIGICAIATMYLRGSWRTGRT